MPPAGTVGVGKTAVVVGAIVVVVVGVVVQVELVMVLVSRVTSPLRASSRPSMVTPVVAAIDVRARMVPTKVELVPSVAELPTCQNTLQALAPLIKATTLDEAVINVLADWKMNTALGSPWASRVTVPVNPSVPPVYTPDTRVCPARSALTVAVEARPAASL
jgi:hypothetical protein